MTTDPALTARADRRLIRANHRSQRFVLVGVTVPPATQERDRLPVNLAFVLEQRDQDVGRFGRNDYPLATADQHARSRVH